MSDFFKLMKKMGVLNKYLFLLLLRAPFDALRTWMLANLMKSVFLRLETAELSSLPEICVIYGLLCTALFLYNGAIWSIYAAFSAKAEASLLKMMLERLLALPLKQIDRCRSGEWLTRLNSDIQAAFIMMNGPLNLPHLTVSVINTALSSFLLFKCGVLLSGITWAFILPQLWINYHIVLRPVPELKEKSQTALSENTSAIKPLITEAETIRSYDAGPLLLKTCEESSRKLMKLNMKIHMRNALSDMNMRLLGIGGYLAVLLMGYGLICAGKMAFSDVVYCFQIRGSVLAGMNMLIVSLNNLKINSVCVKRIKTAFEE